MFVIRQRPNKRCSTGSSVSCTSRGRCTLTASLDLVLPWQTWALETVNQIIQWPLGSSRLDEIRLKCSNFACGRGCGMCLDSLYLRISILGIYLSNSISLWNCDYAFLIFKLTKWEFRYWILHSQSNLKWFEDIWNINKNRSEWSHSEWQLIIQTIFTIVNRSINCFHEFI
jgi:hypothetical protein